MCLIRLLEMHSPVYYVPAPPPPEAIGGLAFVAHPAATPIIFPPMDPQKAKLLTQINYYFRWLCWRFMKIVLLLIKGGLLCYVISFCCAQFGEFV